MARELTAEILLGAGFRKDGNEYVWRSDEESNCYNIIKVRIGNYPYVQIVAQDSRYNFSSNNVTTVEKLQQALRLCELDDLADKFNNTECEFKPFQKVLVRNYYTDTWRCEFFSHLTCSKEYHYACINAAVNMCIPYEGNEDKVGKVTE